MVVCRHLQDDVALSGCRSSEIVGVVRCDDAAPEPGRGRDDPRIDRHLAPSPDGCEELTSYSRRGSSQSIWAVIES
jgi:hypothetical protein